MLIKTAKSSSSSGGTATAMPSPKSVALGQIAASYPLFAGFKLKNNILKAQQNVDLVEFSSGLNADQVAWQTVQAFFAIGRLRKNLTILQSNLAKAESRVKDYENFLNNGTIADNDLMKVKLQKSNVQLSINEIQNNLENQLFKLCTYLNVDPKSSIVFDISNQALIGAINNETENQRKDLMLYDKQLAISNTNIALARSNYFPSLALTGGLIALNIDQLVPVKNALNFGLGLKYNIASLYKNKTEVKAAQLQSMLVKNEKAVLEDNVKIDINEAVNRFKLSIKKSAVYKESLDQANENLRIVTNKYKNGIVNTDELLEADNQQLQTEINYGLILGDQQQAFYGVLNAQGTLVDYLKNK